MASGNRMANAPVPASVDSYEIIPDRLYWVSVDGIPRPSEPNMHFFSVDKELVYEPFNADFGPLNLGKTYRYCLALKQKLEDPKFSTHKFVHYCSTDPKKRANAAYLVLAYMVIIKRDTADVAWSRLEHAQPAFLPFRDASYGPCSFGLNIIDCLRGLEKAMQLNWFDFSSFDLSSFEHYEKIDNGDMSWVIPNKFLAFAGPSATSIDSDGYPASTPEDYIQPFHEGNITTVVRLNNKQYDRRQFTDHGIKHSDMYFLDGSCPPKPIMEKFLAMAEEETGAIAVHCKAGLGRTGTLIGLYAQKHYGFTGRAFIGWNRICRPGAILGVQQQFLCDMEQTMWQAGAAFRASAMGNNNKLMLPTLGMETMEEDKGQGDRLVRAKKVNSPKNAEGMNLLSAYTPVVDNTTEARVSLARIFR